MKNQWNRVKSVVVLAVLPLVATAAASAHQWMSDNNPIASGSENQVATSVDQMSSKRIHTVALNRSGAIEGRIASIDRDTKAANGLAELKIYFVRDGKIAKETVTNDDGTFIVQGVSEGAYSFVATGQNGFAAYGVRVVANGGTDELNVMEAAAVSPRVATVRAILEQQLPSDISQQILDSSTDNGEGQVMGASRIRLENGTLKGHVLPIVGNVEIVKGTSVHILKNDVQVAEVQADDKGSFVVNDLEPGVYDFVAAGPSGFAAVSFEAIAQETAASDVSGLDAPADSDEIGVSIPQDNVYSVGVYDSMDVYLTSTQDSGFISNDLDYGYSDGGYVDSYSSPIEYAGESIGSGCAAGGSCGSCGDFGGYSSCGSCGGGGGGGGGFGGGGRLFGGGGGLGRLLLLGGLAGGIVAIATDNNNNPTPVSPN